MATREPPIIFPWNLILDSFDTNCWHSCVCQKSDKSDGYFTWRRTWVSGRNSAKFSSLLSSVRTVLVSEQWRFFTHRCYVFQVDTADPPFPRSAGYWWFGCTSDTNAGNNGWFLSGSSFPGLSGAEVGNTPQRSSGGDDADLHNSDVDDLILDAGEEDQQIHNVANFLLPSATSAFYWLRQLLTRLTDLSVRSNSNTEWTDLS